MNRSRFTFALAILLAVSLHAQEQKKSLDAFTDVITDRGLARILYWNNVTNSAAGELAIDYGRPVWKPEYDAPGALDKMTNGKTWRVGKDLWTILDTNLPLKIAGKDIAPGAYYLGVQRSADGAAWSLAFIDPTKARSGRVDAFEIEKAPVLFTVPLIFKTATEVSQMLNITLSHAKDDLKNVMLKISWGKFELTTPVQVTVGS